jgi:hypothetical protein
MTFKERLRTLGFEDYSSYLQSRHWQEFKDRYRQSENQKQCRICRSPKYELHHVTYKRLGAEWLADVTPLCRDCHERLHKYLKENGRSVSYSEWAICQLVQPQLDESTVIGVRPGWAKHKCNRRRTPGGRIQVRCYYCGKWAKSGRTICSGCKKRGAKTLKQEQAKPSVALQARCLGCRNMAKPGQALCGACKRRRKDGKGLLTKLEKRLERKLRCKRGPNWEAFLASRKSS